MAVDTASWIGQVLAGGRYRITAKLGEGGMGFVFKARDKNLGTDVVIKVPRPALLEDPDAVKRFAREIRSLVQLAHPRIVKVLEVGECAGLPFAVMQYLPGGSLQDRRSSMSVADLGSWLPGVAEALDFLHGQGYVHRDVKPGNILFDAHGHVYLGDFGIAKGLASRQQPSTKLTDTGIVLGTPEYMAPELIMGHPYDGRVDQYALAVTVYEVLSGKTPFHASAPAAILVKQTTEQAPPLTEVATGIPVGLSEAVQQGMSKGPDHRYAHCAGFCDAVLAQLAEAEPANEALIQSRSNQVGIECPSCGRAFKARTSAAGKRVRCSGCQKAFRVPANTKAAQTGQVQLRPRSRTLSRPIPANDVQETKESSAAPRKRIVPTKAWLLAGGIALIGAMVVGAWVATDLVSDRGQDSLAASSDGSPIGTDNQLQGQRPSFPKQISNSIGMKLVLIPSGKYTMGLSRFDDGNEGEGPEHEVEISQQFYMSAFEVTQEEYYRVMGTTPSHFSIDGRGKDKVKGMDTRRFPVESVSHDDALDFCRKLTESPEEKAAGRVFRLPTEAEWEYACRAGTTTAFHCGNSLSEQQANYITAYLQRPTAVGSYSANAFGLYDMHGNVEEWCEDWYDARFYVHSPRQDPRGPEKEASRVVRGGSWSSLSKTCRSSYRSSGPPSLRNFFVGFRVACNVSRSP